MAHVYCQTWLHPDRMTIRWSDSRTVFEPFIFAGRDLRKFWELVHHLNNEFANFAAEIDRAEVPPSALQLAEAGHALFEFLLPGKGRYAHIAAEIRQWLNSEYLQGHVDAFEVVGDTGDSVPWNLVYEPKPLTNGLADKSSHLEFWRGFWGIRYRFGVRRRFNPLRTLTQLDRPEVLLAIDPVLRDQLAPDQLESLRILSSNDLPMVERLDELQESVSASAPDLLYLFCRLENGTLFLGDEPVLLESLRWWLYRSESRQVPWNNLIFMLNCVGDSVDGWSRVKSQLEECRFSGLILPGRPSNSANRANSVGVQVLDRFLNHGDAIGVALQKARAANPLAGLGYSCQCPTHLQVRWDAEPADLEVEANPADEHVPTVPRTPLPENPYRPLLPCDRADRPLFACREEETCQLAALIDAPDTRIALLHGRSGVGKSSLMRAGVLPTLEEEAIGYLTLRDRAEPTKSDDVELDSPIIAIRASNDLLGQISLAICAFASTPFRYTTPTGRTVEVDSPTLLLNQLGHAEQMRTNDIKHGVQAPEGKLVETPVRTHRLVEPAELASRLSADSALLGKLLASMEEHLPYTLVLHIERGEELYSLTHTAEDVRLRIKALEAIGQAANLPGHTRFVISHRTEYFGRLEARLLKELTDSRRLVSYGLSALDAEQLAEVIERPTISFTAPHSSETPARVYDFAFEQHLPQRIAVEALKASNTSGEEALPLAQITCARLLAHVEGRSRRIISSDDLKAIGGVAGGIGRYFEDLLRAVIPSADRQAFRRLLFKFVDKDETGLWSRNVLSEHDIAKAWTGRPTALQAVLDSAAAPDINLLEERITTHGERIYCLGHDALVPLIAQLAQEADRKMYGRSRVIDASWIYIPVMILLLSAMFFFGRNYLIRYFEEENESVRMQGQQVIDNQKRVYLAEREGLMWGLYLGQMNQAERALEAGDILQLQQLLEDQKMDRTSDNRGFEWRHFRYLADRSKFSFPDHFAEVTAVAMPAGGQVAISTGATGDIIIWDLKHGMPKCKLKGHNGIIHSVAVAPNGRSFAIACEDGSIKIWDFQSSDAVPKVVNVLKGHKGPVTGVRFSKDGSKLFSTGQDQSVRVWNIAEGKEVQKLENHRKGITDLAVSPDGSQLATCSADGVIILWDLTSGKQLHTLKSDFDNVCAIAYSTDGKTVASGHTRIEGGVETGIVQLWDTSTSTASSNPIELRSPPTELVYSPDGKKLVIADQDCTIHLVNSANHRDQRTFYGHVGWINDLVVAEGTSQLVSGSIDGTVKVWNLDCPPDQLVGHNAWTCAMAMSADQKLLATGDPSGKVFIWRLDDGALEKTFDAGGGVLDLTFINKGNRTLLAAMTNEADKQTGDVIVWDVETGKSVHHLTDHKGGATSIAASRDGSLLVTAGTDGSIKVRDAATGEVRREWIHPSGGARCIALSPEGKVLATSGNDGVIHLWNVDNGESLIDPGMTTSTASVTALRFSPTGNVLVSAGEDGSITLWDPSQQIELQTFRGHKGAVFSLSFDPTAGTLASGGQDGTVRLWDLRHKRPRFTFHQDGPVRAVLFSPDGRLLCSGGHDNIVRIRRTVPPDPPVLKQTADE